MSINKLPHDVTLRIAHHMDGVSIAKASTVWRPLALALNSGQATDYQIKKIVRKFSMLEGSAGRGAASPQDFLNSFLEYCSGWTNLQYAAQYILPMNNAHNQTMWVDHRRALSTSFFGESGGCLYTATRIPYTLETELCNYRVEIQLLPSHRTGQFGSTTLEHDFSFPTPIKGIAIDPLQDLICFVESPPMVKDPMHWPRVIWSNSTIHFYSLATGEIVREPFILASDWQGDVVITHFEIMGDVVGLLARNDFDGNGTSLLQFVHMRDSVLLFTSPQARSSARYHSFHFLRPDLVLISEDAPDVWEHKYGHYPPMFRLACISERWGLRQSSEYNRELQSLVPQCPYREIPAHITFVPNVSPPARGGRGLATALNTQPGPDAKFYADPDSRLVGIRYELKPHAGRAREAVFFIDEEDIMAGNMDAGFWWLEHDSQNLVLNGRRLCWAEGDFQGRTIFVQDFNPKAMSFYRDGAHIHCQDPNWVTVSKRSALNTIDSESVVTSARGTVKYGGELLNIHKIHFTQDSVVLIQEGRFLRRPEAYIARVLCF